MPGRYAWLALGLGAYLAFAVSSLPASTAYRLFAPSELRLMGVTGTVWSGGAALGSAGGFPLHDIRWQVGALPLFTGRVSGRLQARLADGFVDTRLTATPRRVELRDVKASTSLPSLGGLLPIKGMQGLVSLALDDLRLANGRPTAVLGRARLAKLAVPPLLPGGGGSTLIPLGDYEIVFKDAGGNGIAAEFHDTGGPLQVSGSLALDKKQNYTLRGFVAARPDASPELVQGLRAMTGEPDSAGRRPFSLSGSL